MAAFFNDYETIRKSGLFDPAFYLASYPDVAEQNIDPLLHYLEQGAAQGHSPHPDFDVAFYLHQCRDRGEEPGNPLLHFIRIGAARGLKPRQNGTHAPTAPTTSDTEPDRAAIVAAVESLGVSAAPDGGLRVSINGWALAAAPIAEIDASVGDRVVGTAVYGLDRPDIAALYPGRGGADRCGFILAFELPRQKQPKVEVVLTVRTEEGEVGRRPLLIDVPPQDVEVAVADPLSDEEPKAPPPARPPMQLYLDEVTVSPSGVLHIEGWVVCLVQIR
jgi:hypothetical protein